MPSSTMPAPEVAQPFPRASTASEYVPAAFSAPASVEPAPAPSAPPLPNFGSGPRDGAESLMAAPLGSLGVVQLAERLALAISRRRAGAATGAENAPEAAILAAAPAFAAPPAHFSAPVRFDHAVADEPTVRSEASVRAEPEAPARVFSGTVIADPAATVPSNATLPAMPAAFRPLSFDEVDDDEPLESLLPPRTFSMSASAVPIGKVAAAAGDEAVEPQDDGFGSLLGMKTTARAGFVRIDEPVDEAASVEPVVIFPGQAQRIMPTATPFEATDGAGPRPFDAPPQPSATPSAPISLGPAMRVPVAQASQPADAQETERALKAALATLQRMSGAA